MNDPEKQDAPGVFINNEDAFSKILALEGDTWVTSGCSSDFYQALYSWLHRDLDGYFENDVIYGASGMHRYWVDSKGEIFFSVMHGKNAAYKAQLLGFRFC
jgi:hypothetical protein